MHNQHAGTPSSQCSNRLVRTDPLSGAVQAYVHTFLARLKNMHLVHGQIHRQLHPVPERSIRFDPADQVIL